MRKPKEATPPPEQQPKRGYGKPPVEHQFKPNHSGNPRGRPKKVKLPTYATEGPATELRDLIMAEAYRVIQIRENDKVVEMPTIQAILRQLNVTAVKGNLKAQLTAASFVDTAEKQTAKENSILLDETLKYRDNWWKIFEQCDAAGQPRPDPVPHPDDISFNMRTAKLLYNGPAHIDEKVLWDEALRMRDEDAEELEYLRKSKKDRGHDPDLVEEIRRVQARIDRNDRLFPSVEKRRQPGFNIHHWREAEEEEFQRREKRRFKETQRPVQLNPANPMSNRRQASKAPTEDR